MKTIPTPTTSPSWQRFQWIFDPVSYLENNQAKYPDMFIASGIGFGDRVIMTSNPQAIQEVLSNDRKLFKAPSGFNSILRHVVGNSSTMLIEGDRHRKRRQLVMPSFHGERLKAYGDRIIGITHEIMTQLPIDQQFLARNVMQSISLEIIIETVFGITQGERYRELKQLFGELTELFESPLTSSFLFFSFLQQDWGKWSPWGKFLHRRQQIDNLIYAEIADRHANPDPNRTDILALLMASRDEEGNPLTDEELRDELMGLLLAGHETTATAMSWALYWLHCTPKVKYKLCEELANFGESPDAMDIARLPYLTAVCNETLRICPVAMLTFPRVAQEPVEIIGYPIKPGDIVMGCMYLTHQREDLYPNHHEFRPERFLERQYSPYEFIPFGGGVRRCLGEALAQFEMKLVLATIMTNYQLKLADTRPEKLQRRGVTLAPARGVKMLKEKKLSLIDKREKVTVN